MPSKKKVKVIHHLPNAPIGTKMRGNEIYALSHARKTPHDTAIVCKPINSLDFWDLKIADILCKPHF